MLRHQMRRVSGTKLRHLNQSHMWITRRCCPVPTAFPRFLATQAASSGSSSVQRTVLRTSPLQAYLDSEEIDAQVLPSQDVSVQLTSRAAQQLQAISHREQNPSAALRIAVHSGGCHGYQYKMELAKSQSPDDYVLSHPDVEQANVIVDAVSLPLINGSTIDYTTELIGSSFQITHNPHATDNGCGCGVSWELKL